MLNNVTLIGRLTKDLELRKTTTGVSVCDFTLAVDRSRGEGTDFINCRVWRQSAEYLTKYAEKGFMIYIAGRIQTGSYENRDGNKVYTTQVIGDETGIIRKPANKTAETAETAETVEPEHHQMTLGGTAFRDERESRIDQPETFDDIDSDDLPFY